MSESRIKAEIDSFLNNVSNAGIVFEDFHNKINDKDNQIKESLDKFYSFFNNLKIDTTENEFSRDIEKTIIQYKENLNSWSKRINSYMDGIQFINMFEKSMLVVAFGNVNVGKSSLGNFISGSIDEFKKYYNENLDYYTYDLANSSKIPKPVKLEGGKFKENFKEETTSIQYYTLKNGLTWVDSPGIHSINGQNEELAKKYVDYADLVIFVMSSSSPLKKDEFIELKRLIDNKKPILIVINKSDIFEEDEVDGELVGRLVAKSNIDRQKQESYVKEKFTEEQDLINMSESIDAISVSVKLAKEALNNNDYQIFLDSGIPRFYNELGSILKEDCLEIKKKAPIQRLNNLIDDIINGFEIGEIDTSGLKSIRENFENILKNAEKSIDIINSKKESILEDTKSKSMPEIDILVSKLSLKIDDNKNMENVQSSVEKIILNNLNKIMNSTISECIQDFNYEKITSVTINFNSKLEAKYRTETYTEYTIKEVNRAPKGLLEHIGSFFGQTYTTIKTVPRTSERKIIVGDNSYEVIDSILSNIEKELSPVVDKKLSDICRNYFEKEKNIVESIIKHINILEEDLIKNKIIQ